MGTQQGGLLMARLAGGFEASGLNAGPALTWGWPCASVSSSVTSGPVTSRAAGWTHVWEEPGTQWAFPLHNSGYHFY